MNRKLFHIYLSSSVALVTAVMPQIVLAQTQDSSATAASQVDIGQDIVVTAQRRSERLKDVPIALVARTSEQLTQSGATAIRDLTAVTPGLTVSGTGANVQPAIRGIHSDQTDPGNDPNVSLYIDGVYQSSQLANNLELADVDRVEVLKGPQGTLFGRNATGGAIRVFTHEPTDHLTGTLDLSYGKLNEFQAKGYISGPIAGDTLEGSLSGNYMRQDGYTRDIITGKMIGGIKTGSIRGKLLFQPADNLKIELIGTYVKRRDENSTLYQPIDGRATALGIPGAFPAVPGAIVPQNPRETAVNQPAFTRSTLYTGAVKIDWDLGVGTLSSISAYNKVKALYTTDADFTQLNLIRYPIGERQDDFSQEVTFASEKFGIAQITAGLFYYNGKDKYDPLDFQAGGVDFYGFMYQNTQAYAGFGEATLTPMSDLNIILGARYSHEKRSAASNFYGSLTPEWPGADALTPIGSVTFKSFTPRASIRYTLPGGDNIYFTYSKGFKSGGYNLSGANPLVPPSLLPFKPEKVDAFEIGLKTAARRPISANLSAFYYNYKNQQVQASVDNFNFTSNAASSHIYGVDADVVLRPTSEFNVTVAAAWLHARFKNFENAVVNVPYAIANTAGCMTANCTNTVNLSGGVEPYSPSVTVGVTANYEKDLEAGKLSLSSSLYMSSKYYFDNNHRVGQPSYSTLSARAGFEPRGTGVTIYVYGRNLTNTRYIYTTFINNEGDGVTYATPRTFGIGANYKF